MTSRYLLLWLQAPLQAWGHDSKFGRRDTLNFPTKSGVMGLICCALGAGGKQCELLAKFAPLTQTVVSFVRSQKITENKVKQSNPELLLRDFHMVGSGYDDKDPWASLLIPKTAEGRKAVGGGTKMTYRFYLQENYFAVILQVPNDLAETLANALITPVWDLYLGRKTCVPTDFVYRGLFDTEETAIDEALLIASAKDKSLIENYRVKDGDHEGGEMLILNDVPLQFGQVKRYRDRRVTVVSS